MVLAVAASPWSEWIEARWRTSGDTVTAFAQRIGVSHVTMLNWLDKGTRPQRDVVVRVARATASDEDAALRAAGYRRDEPSVAESRAPYLPGLSAASLRLVPVVAGTVHAGAFSWEATGETTALDSMIAGGKDVVGIKVEGDCLAPQIEPGDMVFVDRAELRILHGWVVVIVDDAGSVLLRRVQEDDSGGLVLVSNKNAWERPANARVAGRVVGLMRSV